MINIQKLYKKFILIRFLEEEIVKKYSEGKMRCPTHISIGQEAISVAFSQVVDKKDFTISTHRPHAHYIAKGGNINSLVAELKDTDESLNPEEIQTLVYSIGKKNGYEKNLREWFKLIYEVVFGVENGPRMGFFVKFFGLKETIELINKKIK